VADVVPADDITGTTITEMVRYLPWGEAWSSPVSTTTSIDETTFHFTGQREEADIGLYDYKARWYDPQLGRFIQPDTIVPDPGDPQSLNRYTYGANNPVKYRDPSGHAVCFTSDCELVEHPLTGNIMVPRPSESPLYRLIARIARGQDTASGRMKQVFKETIGTGQIPWGFGDIVAGTATRTHFRGIGAARGDTGFAGEFRDDYWYQDYWGGSNPESKQVGHFLTAVDMGTHGGWVHSIVGHEQAGDSQLGLAHQLLSPSATDKAHFRAALALDESGYYAERDAHLMAILDPNQHGSLSGRKGNSLEDLRLSARGYRLGQMITGGSPGMQTNKDVANWIALNVSGG
jgi:RHS repeat-associated protein